MDDASNQTATLDEQSAHIKAEVDQAPPISPRQMEHLRRILAAAQWANEPRGDAA